MKFFFVVSICCLALGSCSQQKAPEEVKDNGSQVRVVKEFHPNGRLKSTTEALGKLRHGISRNYRTDGTLESEINYVQNQKHGLAKNYYADGKTVKNEINYLNGSREGEAKWYYPSGKLYRMTPYSNNRINGIRLTYYENGKIQAELPYNNSQPGMGLKEYMQDGKLKDFRGMIQIREEDRVSLDNSYTLLLSISDGTRDVEFYTGKLTAATFWNEKLTAVPTENGIGKIKVFVPKGTFKMETLNLVARIKTSLGHTRILQQEYHLAVENKF